jgi:hypothetical protein
MKKYIHTYIVNDQTIYTTLQSWSDVDLSGNKPMIISLNESENGYENISSIENWEKYGNNFKEKYQQIKTLFEETDWLSLTLSEKEIVAKYFLVDKTLRDEVLTQQEQDDNNYYKLYNYISEDVIINNGISNLTITPKSIDYKKDVDGKLHPNYEFDNLGFLTGCTYYTDVDISQNAQGFTQYDYTNPILRYTASYTIKSDGYVGSRTVNRKWYMTDGTLSDDAKITEKVYQPMEARDEGKRRRRNLINMIIVNTVGLIIMTSQDLNTVTEAEKDAIDFLKEVNQGINEYYEYGSRTDSQGNPCKLIQDITNSTYPRLDNYVPNTNDTVTIRQYLISKLDV